jgi:hypothetical protein
VTVATPDLTDVRLKLDRASEHLAALKAEMDQFLETEPYSFAAEFDADRGTHLLRARVRQEPPRTLSLLVGDFAHNARSVLDNLACELAVSNGADPEQWGGSFPIFLEGPAYRRGRRGRQSPRDRALVDISDPHRTIIDQLQPFQRGHMASRDPLWRLHELNNADKHRILQPTLLTAGNRGEFTWRQVGHPLEVTLEFEFPPDAMEVHDGTDFGAIGGPTGVEMEVSGHYDLSIAFGRMPLPYSFDELDRIHFAVDSAIGRFG